MKGEWGRGRLILREGDGIWKKGWADRQDRKGLENDGHTGSGGADSNIGPFEKAKSGYYTERKK